MPSVQLTDAEEALVASVREMVALAKGQISEKLPGAEEVAALQDHYHSTGERAGWLQALLWFQQDLQLRAAGAGPYEDLRHVRDMLGRVQDKMVELTR